MKSMIKFVSLTLKNQFDDYELALHVIEIEVRIALHQLNNFINEDFILNSIKFIIFYFFYHLFIIQ